VHDLLWQDGQKARCSLVAGKVAEGLKYTRDHEWVRQREAVVVVGLTDYAQMQLGEIVFVELPKVGERFEASEPFGTVESVKAVSELYAPVTGEVIKVNEELADSPENINADPYGTGWLIEMRMASTTQVTELLTPAEYTAYTKES
jgi:glycine cleavage system H protein